jgi:hypothetical protein
MAAVDADEVRKQLSRTPTSSTVQGLLYRQRRSQSSLRIYHRGCIDEELWQKHHDLAATWRMMQGRLRALGYVEEVHAICDNNDLSVGKTCRNGF